MDKIKQLDKTINELNLLISSWSDNPKRNKVILERVEQALIDTHNEGEASGMKIGKREERINFLKTFCELAKIDKDELPALPPKSFDFLSFLLLLHKTKIHNEAIEEAVKALPELEEDNFRIQDFMYNEGLIEAKANLLKLKK